MRTTRAHSVRDDALDAILPSKARVPSEPERQRRVDDKRTIPFIGHCDRVTLVTRLRWPLFARLAEVLP